MQRENGRLNEASLELSLALNEAEAARHAGGDAVRSMTEVAIWHAGRQDTLGYKVPNPSSEGVVVVRFRGRRPVHVAAEDNSSSCSRPFVDLRTRLSVRSQVWGSTVP
jgi:hypothetical protein